MKLIIPSHKSDEEAVKELLTLFCSADTHDSRKQLAGTEKLTFWNTWPASSDEYFFSCSVAKHAGVLDVFYCENTIPF